MERAAGREVKTGGADFVGVYSAKEEEIVGDGDDAVGHAAVEEETLYSPKTPSNSPEGGEFCAGVQSLLGLPPLGG